MILDPTSDIGKVRLRVADWQDLPYFPDSVYSAVIGDSDGNLPKASKTMAMYILGVLAHKTHRKLNQIEVWGAEAFKNYKEFLLLTVKDPAFMDISPIPYSGTVEFSPIMQFQSDWNKNYYSGTQSQELATDASNSPNDGSLYGPLGTPSGWQLA